MVGGRLNLDHDRLVLQDIFEANQFTQEHNLLLTAPFMSGNSKVTEDEALLLVRTDCF